jgi:hypothetical protein
MEIQKDFMFLLTLCFFTWIKGDDGIKRIIYQKRSDAAMTVGVDGAFVDLRLPENKKPMDLESYRSGMAWSYFNESSMMGGEKVQKFEKVNRNLPYGKASSFIEKAVKDAEAKVLEVKRRWPGQNQKLRTDVGNKTGALGSDEDIYFTGNMGLFGAVLEAYNHHWNLRVTPDDFWFPVIRKVAAAIDANSGKEAVRKFFVDGDGKKR